MAQQQKSQRTIETEKRQEKLKELILRLHEGEDQDVIKKEFAEHFSNVSAFEIAVMERRLMAQEGIEAEEIMRLCNIHASLFTGAVEKPENISKEMEKQGHPVQVLKQENLAIESALERIERVLAAYMEEPEADLKSGLLKQLAILWQFDIHYERKENSMFPIMERYGILAPPKVMWGVDDNIRMLFKEFKQLVEEDEMDKLLDAFAELKYELEEMIVKEEEILIPMVTDVFNEDDWIAIAEESEEMGYCIVKPEAKWVPERKVFEENGTSIPSDGKLNFGTGHLTFTELEKIMNLLPLEISFIDANDTFVYFNNNSEKKIFPRTKNALGRQVQNCHPPKSVDKVMALLNAFKTGTKDAETLWFRAKGKFLMVTYKAVRDDKGTYLGTLEYVQDIGPITELEGENKTISE